MGYGLHATHKLVTTEEVLRDELIVGFGLLMGFFLTIKKKNRIWPHFNFISWFLLKIPKEANVYDCKIVSVFKNLKEIVYNMYNYVFISTIT